MGFWKTLANFGMATCRKGGRLVTYSVTHPKNTLITGAVGYAGWEYLAKDQPLIDSAGDIVGKAADVTFGSNRVDKAKEVAGNTVETVGDTLTSAGEKIEHATDTLSSAVSTAKEATGALSGVSNFFQGLTTGNGLGMIGNFFRNLLSGNVGGMGIAGLIGAAILCFGRFGFLGKILGGILAMMVIGNNFRPVVSETQQVTPSRSQSPQLSQIPEQQQDEIPTIHRGR